MKSASRLFHRTDLPSNYILCLNLIHLFFRGFYFVPCLSCVSNKAYCKEAYSIVCFIDSHPREIRFQNKVMVLNPLKIEVVTISGSNTSLGRSQWPCGLRRRSTAARLLRSRVRILRLRWSRGLHAGLWYQDRGFAPDRSRRIFPTGKIHSMQYDTIQTTIESRIPEHWSTRYEKKNPTGGMDVCLLCVVR
jgi:hypothetical protein